MKPNTDTLRAVGTALFGPSWQTPLAAELGVTDRTMRYWVAGQTIPDGVWADIAALCEKRAGALSQWAAKIAGAGMPRQVQEAPRSPPKR